MSSNIQHPYERLTPDRVMDAVESQDTCVMPGTWR